MTWHTQIGERTLKGAEAALIRMSLGHVVDMVEAESAGDTDPWGFGVPVFDQLAAPAKLALLAEVGWGLLRDTDACPKLTAMNEAAVAILFANVEDSIQIEVDAQKDDFEDSIFWRPLVLAIYHDDGDKIDLPASDCTDMDEWNLLVDVLSDRILWDDDFNDADRFLDAPPDEAESLRDRFGIDDDYYRAIPPDPSESEFPGIRAKLKELYQG